MKPMIIDYDSRFQKDVIELFNAFAKKIGYCEMDDAAFQSVIGKKLKKGCAFVLANGGEAEGFCCGCTGSNVPFGDASGYITCVITGKNAASDENFTALLKTLEDSFKSQGKIRADVSFFNPMMLSWHIPGRSECLHNNAPGAPSDSDYYRKLLQNGYRERTRECAMYLDLKKFSIPDEIAVKKNTAGSQGFEVSLYDRKRHYGIEKMLKGFCNPLWEHEIEDCAEQGVPFLLAAKDGKAVGFAGPVLCEKSGRGYFAGIGVDSSCRGNGLGKILFFELCSALKAAGAKYMSLFTGIKNPAVNIYKSAGFVEVRDFSVMRKELDA